MSDYHRLLKTARWQRTRRAVFSRDKHRCQRCGKAGRLECHHIVPLHKRPDQDFYKLENLQTLCRRCHIWVTKQDRIKNRRTPFDRIINRIMQG